ASPDIFPVNIGVNQLTIQGDPNATDPSTLPSYDLNLKASHIVLNRLNLGTVTAASTVNNEFILDSHLFSFTELLGISGGVGQNSLDGNVISGFVDLQGNLPLSQATSDTIIGNTFTTSADIALKLTNASLTIVHNNTIVDDAPFGTIAPIGI